MVKASESEFRPTGRSVITNTREDYFDQEVGG
jgi:hypothetical protein